MKKTFLVKPDQKKSGRYAIETIKKSQKQK